VVGLGGGHIVDGLWTCFGAVSWFAGVSCAAFELGGSRRAARAWCWGPAAGAGRGGDIGLLSYAEGVLTGRAQRPSGGRKGPLLARGAQWV